MSAFTCPNCGKTTGGNEKFCKDCGQALIIACPGCGETWRFMFDYKFCPVCGHNMKGMTTLSSVSEIQTSIVVEENTSTVIVEDVIEEKRNVTVKKRSKS